MNKFYAALLLVSIISLKVAAQSNFKMQIPPTYIETNRITNEVYACIQDSGVYFRNYKGNLVANRRFDSYVYLKDQNLIVTARRATTGKFDGALYGIINCNSYKTVEFSDPFDGFLGVVNNKLYFTKGDLTYQFDQYYNISLVPGLRAKDELASPMTSDESNVRESIYIKTSIELHKLSSYKDYVLVSRIDHYQPKPVHVKQRDGSVREQKVPVYYYGIFDLRNSRYLIEPKYSEIGRLNPDFIRVQDTDSYNYHYINWDGSPAFGGKTFEEAGDFSEGLAALKKPNGKWTFVDKNGSNFLFKNIEIDSTNDNINELQFNKQRLCIVSVNGKYGVLKTDGKFLINPIYDELEPIPTNEQAGDDEDLKEDYNFIFSKELNHYLFMFKDGSNYGAVADPNQVLFHNKRGVAYIGHCLVAGNTDKTITIRDLNDNHETWYQCDSALNLEPEKKLITLRAGSSTSIINFDKQTIFVSTFDDISIPYNNYIWIKQDHLWGLGNSSNLSAPKIEWTTPQVNVSGLNGLNAEIKATIISYSGIDTVRISYDNKSLMITGAGIRKGNNDSTYYIDQLISFDKSAIQPAIFVTITTINAVGGSNSSKLIPFSDMVSNFGLTATKKLAILIGNKNYQSETFQNLPNSVNDIKALTIKLKQCRYEVIADTDLSFNDFKSRMDYYKKAIIGYDQVVFYYSGHGLDFNNRQYFIPIDCRGASNIQDLDSLIDITNILGIKTNTQQFLLISDACRTSEKGLNNRNDSSTNSTLPPHTMIWYSSNAQAPSLDFNPETANSMFTGALLRYIDAKHVTLDNLVKYVNTTMVKDFSVDSDNQTSQVVKSESNDLFYFNP